MVQSTLLRHHNIVHYFYGKDDVSAPCILPRQVHGTKVNIISRSGTLPKEADAMVTTRPVPIGVQTADCLPILLYDPKKRIAAAVHAGWRGLLYGVILNTLSVFSRLGSDMGSVIAAIGPHIRVCCYDVPVFRSEQFVKRGYGRHDMMQKRHEKTYLNLSAVAADQMIKAGVQKERIETIAICTKEHTAYYSYREGTVPGQRNISMIQMI